MFIQKEEKPKTVGLAEEGSTTVGGGGGGERVRSKNNQEKIKQHTTGGSITIRRVVKGAPRGINKTGSASICAGKRGGSWGITV